MDLPPRRLLNAMWSFIVERLAPEGRQELEDRLAAANAAHITVIHPKAAGGAVAAVRGRSVIPGTATHGIRPPSWWKGDKAAYRSMVAADVEIHGRPTARAV